MLSGALLSEVFRPLPQHYEVDIYAAAPLFWACILAAASAFIISIIWQAHHNTFRSFGLSFFGLLLCTFSIFCHPLFAGYYIYGWPDPYTHLRYLTAIVAAGRFVIDPSNPYSQVNHYPVTHIVGAEIAEVASLPAQKVALFLIPLFSVLSSLFIYCLASALSTKREHALVATAVGVIPFLAYYHAALYPHGAAVLLFPMAFYLLFKSWHDVRFGALLVLLLIVIPFVHPIISIILVASFFAVFAAERINKARGIARITRASFTMACFAGIMWFAWWSVQESMSNVQRVIEWLKGETILVPRTGELTAGTGSGVSATVELLLKMYGVQITYLVLSLVAIGLIVRQVYARRSEVAHLFILATASVTTFFSYVVAFMSAGVTTFGRLLGANATFWAVPILAAMPLSVLNKRKTGVIIVSCFIVATFVLGVGAVYRSPWNGAPNWHFTYQDEATGAWASQHIVSSSKFYSQIGVPPPSQLPESRWGQGFQEGVEPHFGYTNHTTFGDSLDFDTFISMNMYRQSEVAKTPLLTASGGIWGRSDINQDDVNRLNQDPSVNLIYTTSDSQVLYVTH